MPGHSDASRLSRASRPSGPPEHFPPLPAGGVPTTLSSGIPGQRRDIGPDMVRDTGISGMAESAREPGRPAGRPYPYPNPERSLHAPRKGLGREAPRQVDPPFRHLPRLGPTLVLRSTGTRRCVREAGPESPGTPGQRRRVPPVLRGIRCERGRSAAGFERPATMTSGTPEYAIRSTRSPPARPPGLRYTGREDLEEGKKGDCKSSGIPDLRRMPGGRALSRPPDQCRGRAGPPADYSGAPVLRDTRAFFAMTGWGSAARC
jgi:hypothetical protein